MVRKYLGVISIVLFLAASLCFGESFRVRKVVSTKVSTQQRSQKVQMGYNDALCIALPKDLLFIEGVEVEIKIPQVLLEYRGSVAYALYEGVTPQPEDGVIDYDGKRVFVEGMPPRLSVVLQIPITDEHSIESSPYATILPVYTLSEQNHVFLRFQPVMKGLPLNIEDLIFDITIKPLLNNNGLFDLQVEYPTDSTNTEFSLYINEEQVAFTGKPLLLPAGMHHLSIVSEHFRNEVRTFSVNPAEKTKVSVALIDIAPTMNIIAPENAIVYLNDAQTETNKTFIVEPGDYSVRIVVGDYEIIKNVTAVLGKSYEVSLLVDVLVTETP